MIAASGGRGRRAYEAVAVTLLTSSHELPEQALQRVVERPYLEQAHLGVTDQAGQGTRELLGPQRLDHDAVAVGIERDAADRLELDEGGGQAPRAVGANEHVAGTV